MTRWQQTRLRPDQGGKMTSYSPPADVVAMVRAMEPWREFAAYSQQRPPLKVGDRIRYKNERCLGVFRNVTGVVTSVGVSTFEFDASSGDVLTGCLWSEGEYWERIPDEPKQRSPLKVGDRVRLLFRGVVGVVENVHHYWFDFCPLDGKNRETIALNSEGVYWERLPDEVKQRPPLKVGDRVWHMMPMPWVSSSWPCVCVVVECRQFSALIAAEGNDQQTETVAYVDEGITWERIPDEPKQRSPLKIGDRIRYKDEKCLGVFRNVTGVVTSVGANTFEFDGSVGAVLTGCLWSEGEYWERIPDEVTR